MSTKRCLALLKAAKEKRSEENTPRYPSWFGRAIDLATGQGITAQTFFGKLRQFKDNCDPLVTPPENVAPTKKVCAPLKVPGSSRQQINGKQTAYLGYKKQNQRTPSTVARNLFTTFKPNVHYNSQKSQYHPVVRTSNNQGIIEESESNDSVITITTKDTVDKPAFQSGDSPTVKSRDHPGTIPESRLPLPEACSQSAKAPRHSVITRTSIYTKDRLTISKSKEHHPTSIDHHGNIPESVLLPPEVFSKHTKAPSDYAITTTLPDTADKPIIQSDEHHPVVKSSDHQSVIISESHAREPYINNIITPVETALTSSLTENADATGLTRVLYDSSCPVDFLNNGGVHSGVILAKAHYSNITEYVDANTNIFVDTDPLSNNLFHSSGFEHVENYVPVHMDDNSIGISDLEDKEGNDSSIFADKDPLSNNVLDSDIPGFDLVDNFVSSPYQIDDNSMEISDKEEREGNDPNGAVIQDTSDIPTKESKKRKVKLIPKEQKTRKRKRNPENWEKNVNSKKYRSGESYINGKGKEVEAKRMGPGCKETCRYSCHTKVTESLRTHMFKGYYKGQVVGRDKSWEFILRHVKRSVRREVTRDDSRRSCSYTYFFKINGRETKVCKTMFCSTLSISNTVIETAFKKLGAGNSVSPSKRGTGSKRNNTKMERLKKVKDSVRMHIEIFPKVDGHYVRKDSNMEYLEEGVSVADMHRSYLLWMEDNEEREEPITDKAAYQASLDAADESSGSDLETEPIQEKGNKDDESSESDEEENADDDLHNSETVGNCEDDSSEDETAVDGNKKRKSHKYATLRQYRDVFNEDFNIGKHIPKKDQCDFCFQFKHATEEEKDGLLAELEDHHILKDKIRDMKIADRALTNENGNEEIAFCCFDLQKVLYTPQGASSAFYYQSKLAVYNLTCWRSYMGVNKAYCFTWHEAQAGRGANEVASCVLKFIAMTLKELPKVKIIKFWSDNCPSQNKNRFFFAMIVYACAQYNIAMIHTFLLKGHTQNEADNVHARIEYESRGKRLFVPSHWRKVMRDAKKNDEVYEVVKIDQTDVFDFKDLVPKQNWETDVLGNKVKWTEVSKVEVHDGKALHIQYNYDATSETIMRVDQRKGRPVNLRTYLPPEAYDGLLPMTAKKKKAILALCEKLAVPRKYHLFYIALCQMAPTAVPKKKIPQAQGA